MATGHVDQLRVRRERTAIVRFRQSKPVMLALSHGIIAAGRSVLDYGCGRGEDVAHLKSSGIEAIGWDPHFQADTPITSADVVNLGYELNVIENPIERDDTLRRAFQLAKRALVVAVRVDHALDIGTEFADGFLTSRGSFQKLYEQSEFRQYLERILGQRPHMAALGIAYVFKDELLESSHLASLAERRVEASCTFATEQFSQDAVAKKYMQLAEDLGRPPVPSEFSSYPQLLERFGSPGRIERLAKRLCSSEALAEKQQKRREDILTYIAMMRLQGLKPVPFRSLSHELRADIKMLWPSYSAALQEGESFLYQIGKPENVRFACQSASVGKKLPEDLYVHKSTEEQLGALLRLLLFAARQIVGEPDYNVVKISTDGRKVSFLQYSDFDQKGHPELLHSLRVYLPRASYSIRDYSNSLNPPILHRKETLVDSLHPSYAMFCELTQQEEELGLLSRSDIGTKQAWHALLTENHLAVVGHRLYPVTPSAENATDDANPPLG